MKKALESKNETELYDNLYEFAEMSKIQGIKEYLYEAIEEKTDILIGLDAFTKTIYDDNKDNR